MKEENEHRLQLPNHSENFLKYRDFIWTENQKKIGSCFFILGPPTIKISVSAIPFSYYHRVKMEIYFSLTFEDR